MFQTRIHGRGGQGVVTAAELLSVAAFAGGRHAQAFPSFGSERTGAPVVSYCRIDERPIRTREPIMVPDAVVVQDPTLLHQIDVFAGLTADGFVLINSEGEPADLDLVALRRLRPDRVMTVPATQIARRHIGKPVPNAVLLGGFAALTGMVALADVTQALTERFRGSVAAGNVAAANEAFRYVTAAIADAAGTPRDAAPADVAPGDGTPVEEPA